MSSNSKFNIFSYLPLILFLASCFYLFYNKYLTTKKITISSDKELSNIINLNCFGSHTPNRTPKQIEEIFGPPLEEQAAGDEDEGNYDYTWEYRIENNKIIYFFSQHDFLNKSYIKYIPKSLGIKDVLNFEPKSAFPIKKYNIKYKGNTLIRIYTKSDGRIRRIIWWYNEN